MKTTAIVRAALSVVLPGVALITSFFIGGLGHGWIEPFFFSCALFVVYPLVLLRAESSDSKSMSVDRTVVALAIGTDAWLLLSLAARAKGVRWPNEVVPGVHESMLPMLIMWLGVWVLWQVLAVRRLRRAEAKSPSASTSR